ncbi:MAG: hypothetical protein H6667_14645 [Ardenticatenaceae bacterium]|nr:hypothetical protein [Ardenticatenaceae bacterium]MCB9445522.1 hypothetical protein [Ardenticatenaceae bacterium]
MRTIKRGLPLALAIAFGLLTLVGLLLPLPALTDMILAWVGFLAAALLVLGVLNLLSVHIKRTTSEKNPYSAVLILTVLAVFGLAITDALNITNNGVAKAFDWIQVPLETALASLMAFFLLFLGFHMLKSRRGAGAVLFWLTATFILFSNVFISTTLLPASIRNVFAQIQTFINDIIVIAGVRGLLIGIALGTITMSLRVLLGLDQPYNK